MAIPASTVPGAAVGPNVMIDVGAAGRKLAGPVAGAGGAGGVIQG